MLCQAFKKVGEKLQSCGVSLITGNSACQEFRAGPASMAPNINIQDAESGFLMGFPPPPSSSSSSSQVRQMTETLVHTGKCRCACIYSDKLYFIGGCKALDMLIEPKQAPADVWAACKCVLLCTHARTHAHRQTYTSFSAFYTVVQPKEDVLMLAG